MGGLNCANLKDKKSTATLYQFNDTNSGLVKLGEVNMWKEKNEQEFNI